MAVSKVAYITSYHNGTARFYIMTKDGNNITTNLMSENPTTEHNGLEITVRNVDISKYHVIIIEDIIDTGRTLNEVVKILKSRNPLSFRVITLLDKPDRRLVDFKPDMALFTIPDFFVIGYGLDCGEKYRNLPFIAEYDECK